MIGIIDFGIGNVKAFLSIYSELGINCKVVNQKNSFNGCTHFILPGVGHFDNAMQKFNESNLRDELEKKILVEFLPILGVCVGMQMLGQTSDEGNTKGLGWIKGTSQIIRNKKFDDNMKLPHMGWNLVKLKENISLMNKTCNYFYFLHSFHFIPDNLKNIWGLTKYGDNFASVVGYKNILGVQFHPEKSHIQGKNLLKSFAEFQYA